METDSLLPTIEESELESDSVESRENDQPRRFPSFPAIGTAFVIFCAGVFTAHLVPSIGFAPIQDFNNIVEDSRAVKKNSMLAHSQGMTSKCCGGYAKRTLKRIYESPIAAIFQDSKGQYSFDASGVTNMGGIYVTNRNSWYISKLGKAISFSPENLLVGSSNMESEASGYMSLFHEGGALFAVRGVAIEKLALSADQTSYELVESCSTDLKPNLEDERLACALAIRDVNNSLILLGLMEKNSRKKHHKRKQGRGFLVAFAKESNSSDGSCVWSPRRRIKLPKSVDFPDYSAITLDESGRVAISSQEKSQLWIGKLNGPDVGGLWDIEKLEFNHGRSNVFSFPRNDRFEVLYCNIRGIYFMDAHTLVAVSGKMSDDQDFRCLDKDQSIHSFVIP